MFALLKLISINKNTIFNEILDFVDNDNDNFYKKLLSTF